MCDWVIINSKHPEQISVMVQRYFNCIMKIIFFFTFSSFSSEILRIKMFLMSKIYFVHMCRIYYIIGYQYCFTSTSNNNDFLSQII